MACCWKLFSWCISSWVEATILIRSALNLLRDHRRCHGGVAAPSDAHNVVRMGHVLLPKRLCFGQQILGLHGSLRSIGSTDTSVFGVAICISLIDVDRPRGSGALNQSVVTLWQLSLRLLSAPITAPDQRIWLRSRLNHRNPGTTRPPACRGRRRCAVRHLVFVRAAVLAAQHARSLRGTWAWRRRSVVAVVGPRRSAALSKPLGLRPVGRPPFLARTCWRGG